MRQNKQMPSAKIIAQTNRSEKQNKEDETIQKQQQQKMIASFHKLNLRNVHSVD